MKITEEKLQELSGEYEDLNKFFEIYINEKLAVLIKNFGFQFTKYHFGCEKYRGPFHFARNCICWSDITEFGHKVFGSFPFELMNEEKFDLFVNTEQEKRVRKE